MNIGGAIEGLRKKKEIRQNELADKAQITQSYLSLIESNKKEPNLKTLKAIADALEVPLPIIFFLSITDEDIPKEKQDSYKLLSPLINNVIKDIFIA